MVLIPAGKFEMGSPESVKMDDEHPVHIVRLDSFYLDKHEVTNQAFEAFIKSRLYQTTAEREGSAWAYVEQKWSQVRGENWRKPEAERSSLIQIGLTIRLFLLPGKMLTRTVAGSGSAFLQRPSGSIQQGLGRRPTIGGAM